MIKGIFIVIFAYLLGSINNSIVVGHMFGVKDIREQGSGNAGSTNVLRIIGIEAAALTFAGDVLKGVIAPLIAYYFCDKSLTWTLAAGYAAVFGHVFPLYFGFKGGKGVATSFGAVLTISVLTGKFYIPLILLAVFIVVVAVSRYVSLGSVLVMAAYPIIIAFLFKGNYTYLVFAVLTALTGILKHKKNIIRLAGGTESKIGENKTRSNNDKAN